MVRITGISALAFALLFACSTEKNTFINRKFHGMNAHYNGYFNANELLRQSMETYRASLQEDYYAILPIDPMPSETDVVGMYPAIDTAISKCVKVLTDHSMPGTDKPSQKKEEHNRWIDENWTTVGIAFYYRRNYDDAMKNFKFIKKFFKNDPSNYVGELWMAKTHIAQGELTEAKFNLDFLDEALKAQEGGKEDKEAGEKSSKKKEDKKDKKEAKPAKFPKKIRFDFEKTKADLALRNGENVRAIEYLEESLNHAKRSTDKSRVHFILGQLYEEQGDDSKASEHYKKVLKGNAPFPMMFNARLKKAFLGGGSKKRKELNKMLRDAKNAEFKDQIYYALAGIEFNEGNEEKGVEYLHQSAFYSTTNTRQKGLAYEKLGDLRFGKRDYVNAQRYYDSCAQVINDSYPNAEAIRNKATNLADLVVAVETAYFEDSVQRVAKLSEADREEFIKGVIKKIKEDEEARKKRDAERLRELQANQALFTQQGESGSKWYWYNAKTRAQGYDDFRKLWGNRENEDDWRRSEKIKFDDVVEEVIDSLEVDSLQVEEGDGLTVEALSRDLPLTDSALAESNKRLLAAHYSAGVIYKEQLNEDGFAIKEFEAVLNHNVEDPHNVLSAFQLYKIHETGNGGEADRHKMYILNNYPNSDFANYLRDPNYFVKKKEMDALAEQEYVTVLERYNRGLYYPVITKADKVIEEEKNNEFRAKYILLKAMAMGQTQEDKTTLIPVLQLAVDQYPGTPEAERAAEMISVIKNGYSENVSVSFENKYSFNYDDQAKLYVIVFLDPAEPSSTAKTKIVDFNREFMSREHLKVDSKIYGEGNSQSVVLISEFENESKAGEYIRVYKQTRKHLLDLQNAKILMITADNLKILFQKRNLAEYEKFYEEFY